MCQCVCCEMCQCVCVRACVHARMRVCVLRCFNVYCVTAEMRSRSGTISPVRHDYDSVTTRMVIPRSSSVHDLLERHAAVSRHVTGSFTAGELTGHQVVLS